MKKKRDILIKGIKCAKNLGESIQIEELEKEFLKNEKERNVLVDESTELTKKFYSEIKTLEDKYKKVLKEKNEVEEKLRELGGIRPY